MDMIIGLTTGKHGVIQELKTRDLYCPEELFNKFWVVRIGCRVRLTHKKGSAVFWDCYANLQDAKDFMAWLAGA